MRTPFSGSRVPVLLAGVFVLLALFGMGCSGSSCPGLKVIQRGDTSVCDPAGVRVFFSVTDCDGVPVPNLDGRNFNVINNENGKPFQSEGGSASFLQALNFEFYTVLVLDLSYSIVQNDRLNDLVDGAKHFVKTVIEDQTDEAYMHNVAIYVFGSTKESQLLLRFTQDTAEIYATLEGLRDDPGRGSTNLYGAYMAAIEELNRVRGDDPNKLLARSLVIISDGTHETGDEKSMRREALRKLASSDVNAYSIGIQGDYDEQRLRELASRDDSFFMVDHPSELVRAFGDLAARVEDWSRSHYIMGVCSPLEGKGRSLTVNVTRDELEGSLDVKYDATGFNLTGCSAERVAEGENCAFSAH